MFYQSFLVKCVQPYAFTKIVQTLNLNCYTAFFVTFSSWLSFQMGGKHIAQDIKHLKWP